MGEGGGCQFRELRSRLESSQVLHFIAGPDSTIHSELSLRRLLFYPAGTRVPRLKMAVRAAQDPSFPPSPGSPLIGPGPGPPELTVHPEVDGFAYLHVVVHESDLVVAHEQLHDVCLDPALWRADPVHDTDESSRDRPRTRWGDSRTSVSTHAAKSRRTWVGK